jgi:hypothetical protein
MDPALHVILARRGEPDLHHLVGPLLVGAELELVGGDVEVMEERIFVADADALAARAWLIDIRGLS